MTSRMGLFHIHMPKWQITLVLVVLIYAFFVRVFRYWRINSLRAKYTVTGRNFLNDMTTEDAQVILKTLAELEFPGTYGLSMIMAILRVSRCINLVSRPL